MKTASDVVADGRAAIFRDARKSIFNWIKNLRRGAWALIKEPVKAFLLKLLLIILLIVLIRLAFPYFISFVSYLIARFLRWFFRPFYSIHDNISHAIQALGHGAVGIGHDIAHGAAAVGRVLGDGARALGHGEVGIGHSIAHGASFVGRSLGHGARALGHGAVGIAHGASAASRSIWHTIQQFSL
ncbi:hypothetical protein [Candidatus Synechococcus spongiarum]|nr:hypothetical protein [Candidatus Synechococcus spongiarum]